MKEVIQGGECKKRVERQTKEEAIGREEK